MHILVEPLFWWRCVHLSRDIKHVAPSFMLSERWQEHLWKWVTASTWIEIYHSYEISYRIASDTMLLFTTFHYRLYNLSSEMRCLMIRTRCGLYFLSRLDLMYGCIAWGTPFLLIQFELLPYLASGWNRAGINDIGFMNMSLRYGKIRPWSFRELNSSSRLVGQDENEKP